LVAWRSWGGGGVEASLWGRKGFTARGLYSTRPRALAREAKRAYLLLAVYIAIASPWWISTK
jgi:hypothetical protein